MHLKATWRDKELLEFQYVCAMQAGEALFEVWKAMNIKKDEWQEIGHQEQLAWAALALEASEKPLPV